MTIATWLEASASDLAKLGIASARLDTEIILAHTLGHNRSWLHAHSDETLDLRAQEIAEARLDLRLDYVPIAYIVGHKEFYGRRFSVSPSVLIPRPESEQMIELLLDALPQTLPLGTDQPKQLVDIGTGSGCLGITAKLEHPELSVTLLDSSQSALNVTEKNSRAHQADVMIMKSNLLADYPYTPDIVLANLPYVDPSWDISDELAHEPSKALFAAKKGLGLIYQSIDELRVRMQPGGIAIYEADPRQWSTIDTYAEQRGFQVVARTEFAHRYDLLT